MRGWRASLVLAAVVGTGTAARGVDEAHRLTGVDRARTEFGLTGEGVLVAVIDRGIDAEHPAFCRPDGPSRLDSIFDLTDDSGARDPANPFGEGTIWRGVQIDEAIAKGAPLPTDDLEGRGTTSVGIACGNGAGSPEGRYRGVAPGATPLFVKIKLDPREEDPPVPMAGVKEDEEAAPVTFFELHRLRTALAYCVSRAKALGWPCVICLNFDQMGGPVDGSSVLCRTIDATVGPGVPGLVVVTSGGDKGGRQNRARGTVPAAGIFTLPVEKEAEGEVFVEVWYGAKDRFDVSIQTPTGRFGPYPAPRTGKSEEQPEFQLYHLSSERNLVRAPGGKRLIRVDLRGAPGTYAIDLHGAKVESGRFDAVIGPNPASPLQDPFNRFLRHAAPGSLWDGASARHALCVGCYVHRREWKNHVGRGAGVLGEGDVGALWPGSGTGPTTDGRLGVDVCAPADRIVAPYARRSEWAERRSYVVVDGPAMYGMAGGGAAAAAYVAGVVALMLQRDPTLDAAQVKRIFEETARRDGFTGAAASPAWGHGKIDAHAALGRVAARK